MAFHPWNGPWSYRSTVGGSLVLTSTEQLLGLRVIAVGTSGNLIINGTNNTASEPIPITTLMAFDWTPSAKVTDSTLTFSSTTLQWFAELGLSR